MDKYDALFLYFGVLHPVASTLSKLLEEPSVATAFQGVYFIFVFYTCFSLVGHIQVKYTIILGSYLTHNEIYSTKYTTKNNGSVVSEVTS
jgi:hypothetical protein